MISKPQIPNFKTQNACTEISEISKLTPKDFGISSWNLGLGIWDLGFY